MAKILKAVIAAVLMFFIMTASSCESSKKSPNSYLYKITRQNPDGTVQEWMAGPDATRDNGFIVWTAKNGGAKSISGALTVEPILIPKPKPEPKKEE